MVIASVALPRQPNVWWLLLLHGIAALLLGTLLVSAPAATIASLATFLGFFWLIGGVLSLVRVFVDRSVPWIWSLLSGILGIVAGLFVVNHPMIAALVVPATIVVLLGVDGLVMGVFEIIRGVKGGGMGAYAMGAANILIGVLLLARPLSAALAVPFIFGVILLIEGVGLLYLAFKARRHET